MRNIEMPEVNGTGKFVQLFIKGEPWLKGDTSESNRNHPELLEDILRKHGITDVPTIVFKDGVKIPALTDNANYKIVGLGAYVRHDNVLQLGGWSGNYGARKLEVNGPHIRLIEERNPEIKFFYDNG